ncbi:hypothetical protein [Klebsiella phage vB_KpnS-VAC35]|uniref:Uncharacterized protein n=1 Tax=Klebsiella phage vB_KpnS-VAC35 TaxID=2866696 RepID=A0AAE8YI56_9CAUD|nr:hypothetical protein [Klebsiella phage vB_KpnS-VAC35]
MAYFILSPITCLSEFNQRACNGLLGIWKYQLDSNQRTS